MRSAAFLAFAFDQAGFDAFVESGRPRNAEDCRGFRNADGWHDHVWVLCCGHVVDVTADQYGEPPVLIVPAPDPRYRPGRDDLSRLALTANGRDAVEKLKAEWTERG